MKQFLFSVVITCSAVATATAGIVNYDTNNTTLTCNGVAGCVQGVNSQQVVVGGLTFTYNAGSGNSVVAPSIINLGNIVTTGTSSGTNISGLLLTIQVHSTPPNLTGNLPAGSISGTISTNNSGATIQFGAPLLTTGFGTLPGVYIGSSWTYQVLNPSLGLQAPTVGNPIGQTSIQGAVSDTPEPASLLLLAGGLGTLGLLRFKRR